MYTERGADISFLYQKWLHGKIDEIFEVFNEGQVCIYFRTLGKGGFVDKMISVEYNEPNRANWRWNIAKDIYEKNSSEF